MTTLKRIMVGLDLTPMDDTLIRYAAFLSAELQIDKVYFIHIVKSLDIPQELLNDLEHQQLPPDENLRQQIATRVNTAFSGINTETEVLVEEGIPLKGLLHWSKIKQIDLMLVGRKLRLRGSGVLAQKLLRLGKTGVLFVSETAEPHLNHILVSIDFSEYSEMALNRVLHSALNRPNVKVYCLHVYEVPTGYRTLGMTYEAFEERMRGFAQEKYDRLLSKFPELKDRAQFIMVRQGHDDDIGALVVMEAKRVRADMLVIGAKGLTAAAHFVLGSVTEKILRHDMDIPLLVFKKEKEEVGFLDALLS
ncbi:universal stress protein [Pontibacter cellulosilyticus]|uniref:Universal stress protein n=1 Tax=Pontibacter cellulosilyticus TaxID=1720253 RepID=A0A923N3X2_9BACT|nr:universal stress protein [Pontibacter cellulosilyticus]MBC5991776.1 universal stress protein [Pontibacter cellulosilyticus]